MQGIAGSLPKKGHHDFCKFDLRVKPIKGYNLHGTPFLQTDWPVQNW
jgi:hypothetical protein